MFPQPMSRSEFRPDDSNPDLTCVLEQNLLAGFPPDLALDLVLNELVVRAAKGSRAGSAALALARGDELVCRAATGPLAPDLDVPLSTRDGLSGACLQTRRPQLSVDTEFDPRVDPAVSRHLGIRSILIVPVFDRTDKDRDHKDSNAQGSNVQQAQVTGILEAFSPSPAAFSDSDQKLLEGFAEECARIRRAAIELSQRPPAAAVVLPEIVPSEFDPSALAPPTFTPPDAIADNPLPTPRPPHQGRTLEVWTMVLGTLAILAALGVSFLIGSRVGWLRTSASPAQTAPPPTISKPGESPKSAAATKSASKPGELTKSAAPTKSARTKTKPVAPASDELVVYEKGKVIFRMKPTPAKPAQEQHPPANHNATRQSSNAIIEASSTTKVAPSHSVWLAPAQAEARLLVRTEPHYPPDAIAAHRAGNVVLEVQVAEDGSVSSVRTLSGDPALAAAATDAVRAWRYQPYRRHDHPAQFQTDVTLSFRLPH